MSKLVDLDANYVLDVSYNKSTLSRLLAELNSNGVRYEVRPGSKDTNVYVFVRDNGTGVVEEVSQDEIVKEVIPLYGKEETKRLQFIWQSLKKRLFPKTSELVELSSITRDPRMALYFAFQKSYTKWLVPLAVVGVAFRLFSSGSPWEFNMVYSIAVLAWGITFSVIWTQNTEPKYSDMFGYRELMPVSDSKSTIIKKLCFIPIAFTFTVCLVSFQFICFFLEIYITQIYNGPLSTVLALVPTVLISAYVPVLTAVYNLFVKRLVSWENSTMPERSKSRKLFVFSFLTSYGPLLITLFVYLPLGHLLNPQLNLIAKHSKRYNIPVINDRFVINTDRYRAQFFYFTVTNQALALVMENILPIIMARLPTALGGPSSNAPESRRSLKLATEKYPQDVELLEKVFGYFTGPWGAFNVDDNVRKLVLQFGYIIIFSTIWPLAPLVCIIFNIIMCKLDMWRATQKNRPKWSNDIAYTNSRDIRPITLSPWDSILNFLVWSASLISPTIVIMYRKCNLPGVGFNLSKAAFGEREKWFLESPIRYDWKLIMIYGMLAEHAGMVFHYILTKVASAPASTGSVKSPSELKEKPTIDKGAHVNDVFSFQDVSNGQRIPNNEKESCSSDSMYSSATKHEREHNGYSSTARDYTHGHTPSDNKDANDALEVIKNLKNTTASGVDDTRTLHPPLRVNRPTGADVITETIPNQCNGCNNVDSIPHAPNEDQDHQGLNQNDYNNSQKLHPMCADTKPLPSPQQPVRTSLSTVSSTQGQRVVSSNNMAPSTADTSSVAGATLPATIPTSKNYDERQRQLPSPLPDGHSSTRTTTTPTLDPRRQDVPRPSYSIPQPFTQGTPGRGEQFIPTTGLHQLKTEYYNRAETSNISKSSPTITRSPVDNSRGPVEIIGTPMKIVEGAERSDSRIPIAVDESLIQSERAGNGRSPITPGITSGPFSNGTPSSPAAEATPRNFSTIPVANAPLPSVNGVTQMPVFVVENKKSLDAIPNGAIAPAEVNRMAVETSSHPANGYTMQPEQRQLHEFPSDSKAIGVKSTSMMQGSSTGPAPAPAYDHDTIPNNGIKTVNRRKSNSIKSFTKLIGSPSKKDHTTSKNKKLKSPLSMLKKKFEQ